MRSENRKKTRSVLVRFEPDEHTKLTEVARSVGVSVAELLRRSVDEKTQKTRRAVASDTLRLSDGDRALIAGLTASIARMNGAVVQIAKAVRIDGMSPSLHEEIEAVLKEMRSIQRRCDVHLQGLPK